MSRTHKDRPYWVLKNDPNMDKYATHHHTVILLEEIGEEPVYRNIPNKNGRGWHEEIWYSRKLYKRVPVAVDCTLDVPETGSCSPYGKTNENKLNQKNCHWWLEYYPNVRSNKDIKRLTSGALRSKVRQQLHNAVRDYGSYWEEGDWDDVDIFVDSKQANTGWWD